MCTLIKFNLAIDIRTVCSTTPRPQHLLLSVPAALSGCALTGRAYPEKDSGYCVSMPRVTMLNERTKLTTSFTTDTHCVAFITGDVWTGGYWLQHACHFCQSVSWSLTGGAGRRDRAQEHEEGGPVSWALLIFRDLPLFLTKAWLNMSKSGQMSCPISKALQITTHKSVPYYRLIE